MKLDLHRVRYSYDDPDRYGLTLADSILEERVRSRGLSQNVRVSDRVLPRLFEAAREAGNRLALVEPLTVFVYANAEPNAFCYSDSNQGQILVFVSSTLVTTLQPREWQCIIGHELGHHILGHHRYPNVETPQVNLRVLELKRSAEISADRAGLIACGEIDVALRAMLKVASGLDERHLEVNLSDYMRQLSELRETGGDESIFFSTHPPFPVRVRAVLRFDSVVRELEAGGDATELLHQTDVEIQRDLNSAAPGSSESRFIQLAFAAAFWAAAVIHCADGTFFAEDQVRMRHRFGEDRVEALRRLLRTADSKQNALATLQEKAALARGALEAAPLVATTRFHELLSEFSS